MTWTKLDDNLLEHPKVLRAGPSGAWLFVASLVYSNRYRTDGYVPREAVARLTDLKGTKRLASKLVEVGLWHEAEGGFFIHDFAEYQPRKEALAEAKPHLSSVRAEAGRLGALRKAQKWREAHATVATSSEARTRNERDEKLIEISSSSKRDGVEFEARSEHVQETTAEARNAELPQEFAQHVPEEGPEALAKVWQNSGKTLAKSSGKTLAPIPIPFVKPPHPPQGARERGEANNPTSPDEPLPVSAEPHPSPPPVSEGGEDGAPKREQPPPCESGTFAVTPKRLENAPEGTSEAPARVEIVPPLPAPLAAQQSPCGKLVRPREVRLLEAPFFATAYAEGIVQAKAEKGEDARYVVPHRAQMTLDDAIDGHAPVQRGEDRVKWLRKAAYLFGLHAVGPREQGKLSSYDPGAFLAWVNSGALARVAEAEMAKRRRAERARLPEPTPELTEEEHLRGLIKRNRMVLEKQAHGGVRLMKPAELEAQIADWEARLAELSPQQQANPEPKLGLLSCKPEAKTSLLEYISEPKPEAHSESLAAGAEGGPRG